MATTYDGCVIVYHTSATAAGLPWLCAKALSAAFPGAVIEARLGRDGAPMAIEAPKGTAAAAIQGVREEAPQVLGRLARPIA